MNRDGRRGRVGGSGRRAVARGDDERGRVIHQLGPVVTRMRASDPSPSTMLTVTNSTVISPKNPPKTQFNTNDAMLVSINVPGRG